MTDVLKGLLTPYKIPYNKLRFGRNCDGGYIIFDTNLNNKNKLYSYGICDDVSFEVDYVNKTNAPAFLFDHTITGLPLHNKNFIFIKEPASSDNIIKHINYTSNDNNIILKMDVEGCEWDIFDNIDTNLLCRFQQIIIEFHNLEYLQNECFGNLNNTYDKMYYIFAKLNRFFYLGHIHGNNCGGVKDIPNTIECTYIRKDLVNGTPTIETTPYPIKDLDFPNTSKYDDYTLDWWTK